MHFNQFLPLVVALLTSTAKACGGHTDLSSSPSVLNTEPRAVKHTCKPKIVIQNVRIFDGQTILPPSTVVIDGHVIGTDPTHATECIDADGAVLLPGFIESHAHPGSIAHLESLTRHGITTAFQPACFAPQHCAAFQGHRGLVDMYHASVPATAPGSLHGGIVFNATGNADLLVQGQNDTGRWLREQLSWQPDFIKLIAQTPGHSQETLNSLVEGAHSHGKKVICHAADSISHTQASISKVDQIHHTPLDSPIGETIARLVFSQGQVVVPTLSVMKAFAELGLPGQIKYAAAAESVRTYYEAGVPILAGTDANDEIAAKVPFGSSFHAELELLVEAGMNTLDVLRAATALPAEHWGFEDRGVIAAGKRADLVLVGGNPLEDISATRDILRIWVAGEEIDR